MKNLLFILTTLAFLQFINLQSQTIFPLSISQGNNPVSNAEAHRCMSDELVKKLYEKFPDRKNQAQKIDDAIYTLLNNQPIGQSSRGPVYTIPVVVHIIHANGPENISNAQVLQGIKDLNDAFANQGVYQDANGTDVEIQFCLAQQTPNGFSSNGITRDYSLLTNMTAETDDITLKNINRWNPTKYLNIWLVNEITSLAMGAGVAGYAYLPASHGNPEDGIVNEARWFGKNKHDSKIHVHEAGHYLGLYHTFESGCANNNCLSDGDKVCDTPPDNSTAQFPCNATPNTCSTDDDDLTTNNPFRPIANGGLGDQNDLFQNYMDYGDDICQTLFTSGQKDRMRTALSTARASLLQSKACNTLCTNVINASFTASATVVTVGTNVVFTNTSLGFITNYDWSINNTSFAITQNSNYVFNNTGNYWVVLTQNNNDPNCLKKDSILIKVECNAQASFTSSSTNINPGGQITFTSTSTGATTYQWYVDGIAQVNTPNFIHAFSNAGGYMVYLVTCSATCCDTSAYQFVRVGQCDGKQANIWYFGDRIGLDFNASSTPTVLTNSSIQVPTWNHLEGASSMCDKNGNLLFYTDGFKVWNKNHQQMPNGFSLLGDNSATEGSLILEKPGSNNLYYVFTVQAQGGDNGFTWNLGAFSYSIVDMSLNGGLGDVSVKNNIVYAKTTERLAAVRHSNGTDVWIVTHEYGGDKYRSYLLTCNGLDTVPVISAVGINYIPQPGDWGTTAQGYSAISPNGEKIAVSNNTGDSVTLFDFSTSTGKLSNPLYLDRGWAIAFSGDSKKFYRAYQNNLYQYDLSVNTPAAITASQTLVKALLSGDYWGRMKLAPNGVIYSLDNTKQYVHAIKNPNAKGIACTAVVGDLYFNGYETSSCLPNFLVDYFAPPKASKIQGANNICDTAQFYVKNNCGINNDSIVWILNGQSTIVSSTDSTIFLKPNQQGVDTLITLQYTTCGILSDTLLIQTNSSATNINIGNDTVICGTINLLLDAGNGFSNYLWSNTSTSQTITVTSSGLYWVQIKDAGGCVSSDTILITQTTGNPPVNLGNDTMVCKGKIIVLDAGALYSLYTWHDNSHNQTYTAWQPGTYWVTTIDYCGNQSTDTIHILIDNSGTLNLGSDTVLCKNQSIVLNAGAGYTSYLWQDSSNTQTYNVSIPGTYVVLVSTQDGCIYNDSIKITLDNTSNVFLGNDTIICKDETIILDAGNGFNAYLWQDGSANQTFTASDPGTYFVNVTSQNKCIYSDTIIIEDCAFKIDDCEIGIPDAFSPNGDGINDEFKILGKCVDKITLVIFDRWGEKVFETNNPSQGWDGNFKGKEVNNAVFAYYLKVTTYKGTELQFKGNVSLIR